MQARIRLELARVDGTSVLVASGEIDLATAPILRESLAGQRARLVQGDGDLVLRGPDDTVRRALEVVGLSDWIEE
jgi:anti-anti-sigma regulatory factor